MRWSSVMRSSWISSELRFLISSRTISCSCLDSPSFSASSASMASMMSFSSCMSCVCAPSMMSRSCECSSVSVCSSLSNSSSSASRRWSCRSMRSSTFFRCARSAIWNWSSASSRSRSSIWMMASLRSTSRSWFCDRISMSLRRFSTLAMRMILRHWFWIFSRFTRLFFFSSASCLFSARFVSMARRRISSSILRRSSSSSSGVFGGALSFFPFPFFPFLGILPSPKARSARL
mmetsp:Transcript_11897/g.36054  ORF Transcript_11897/g.36054 Transcript_11897/m.36054 type:complete len:233 (+) Transcript_11897:992-1690(+)